MSPEQASGDGKSITTLTDVYALGVILYELLTNRRPFEADTPLALIRQVADAPVSSPRLHNSAIDADLEAICLKCLAKSPADRYSTANELAEDLLRWLSGEPVTARSAGLTYTLWRLLRRNVGATTKLIIVAVVSASLMSLGIYLSEIQVLLANATNAYHTFPTESTPWLLRIDWSIPNSNLRAISVLLFPIGMVLMGFLTVIAVRSKMILTDIGAGLGAGFIASVIITMLTILPAILLVLVVVPHISNYTLLSKGCFVPMGESSGVAPTDQPVATPADRLIQNYPDLQGMTPKERSEKFMTLVVAKQVVGVFHSVVLASLSIIVYMLTTVVLTVTAGFCSRTSQRWYSAFARYITMLGLLLPLLLGTGWLLLVLGSNMIGQAVSGWDNSTWIYLLLALGGVLLWAGVYTSSRYVRPVTFVLTVLFMWAVGFAFVIPAMRPFLPIFTPASIVCGMTFFISRTPKNPLPFDRVTLR